MCYCGTAEPDDFIESDFRKPLDGVPGRQRVADGTRTRDLRDHNPAL